MSTQTKICFDASYHEGFCGIGIYNFDTKEEIYIRYELPYKTKAQNNSELMETMALVKTLTYMRDRNIESAHLFTDNRGVAAKGVSSTLAKGLNITLNWIPREFNEDADRLSKLAHTLVATPLNLKPMNTSYKTSPVIVEVNADISKKMTNRIKEYSLEKRLNLIKNMYSDRYECMNAIFGEKVHFGLVKKDMKVFRMLKAILTKEEFKSLTNVEIINSALGRFKMGQYNNQDVINHIKMYA